MICRIEDILFRHSCYNKCNGHFLYLKTALISKSSAVNCNLLSIYRSKICVLDIFNVSEFQTRTGLFVMLYRLIDIRISVSNCCLKVFSQDSKTITICIWLA